MTRTEIREMENQKRRESQWQQKLVVLLAYQQTWQTFGCSEKKEDLN